MTTATAAKPFDPIKYKETTREQWQTAARAWNDWTPLLRAWLGPATEIMFDMARIGPGHRVLDVAAGAGDQSLQAAERVGPSGHVLATDISGNILAFAAENARAAGHRNIETKVLDGEDLDVAEGMFDAVISRVGLIYFPDQQKALAGMKRALKPGGRVAAIVYSTAENNKFFSIPVSIIRRRANLPPPVAGQPGPFSLGGPGVLDEAFRKAGFHDVESRIVAAPVRTKSAADCVRFEKESFGALHQMLAGLDEAGREAAWQEIEQELGRFQTLSGFEGPCEMIVAVGVK
jgi:SAM-dependent methyltransferase